MALSIIIVGVGEAEFSNMNALDSDTALLSSRTTGRKAARDIVQVLHLRFACFTSYESDWYKSANADADKGCA